MMLLVAGLTLFFVSHLALAAPGLAQATRGALGVGGRKLLVSLFAAAGLVLVVYGWSPAATAGALWSPPAWTRHVALALMPFALILLVAAYAPAGRIKMLAKHPMLAGVKIWAFAHLVANGEARSIVLFGAFLAYAVFARIAAKRRGDAGAAGATPSVAGDVIAVVGGAAAYGAIAFWLHPILFGVAVVR